MATWIAHLRVAENILNMGYDFKPISFIVGNIGPDSGVPNEDCSNFNPPKSITHWMDDERNINAKGFYDKYLDDEKIKEDVDRYSFLKGYYVHLLTDIEWQKLFRRKKMEPLYRDELCKDSNFIWTIKKDWYGLDYLYLDKHKDCVFHTLFKKIKYVPDYLDYFPKGAFERQVKYIVEFYLGENNQTKENFMYLTEKEMDRFVENTIKVILMKLNES
ncbi:hypothetical protein [Sporanaerobacter acetigenes]|uniref:hypothetical protein n=1 Tax=Sporanaerobacter acetigenes TaxID=165813 RepID=UPI00104DD310|nr:hypothetical protein [Sporanaerobacter acetigenes]